MRRLVLMRHAEAKAPEGAPDRARRVTAGGRIEATAMGGWLAEAMAARGWVLDRAVVSDAERTAETYACVRRSLPGAPDAIADAALYDGGPGGMRRVLASTPDAAAALIMVGHAPTVELVLRDLTGTARPWPTAAMAIIAFAGGWAEAAGGGGRLEAFMTPRDLF